jgi:enoyl-CoA hydratase
MSRPYECFDVSLEGHVVHLRMNRPEKRNSMIPAFWRELPEIVRGVDAGGEARVVVISSTGPHFTAGMDLAVFANEDGADIPKPVRGARLYDTIQLLQETFSCLERCRVPVIAAVQGGCIGGGVDMVTACDLRYATQDAFFCVEEINIGMTADVGTFPRLAKIIPEGIAREMAYTGRRLPAARAREIGLVNEVYADAEALLAAAMETAAEIAAKSPLAIYGSKRMLNYARDHSTADGLDYIGVWNASMFQPSEMAEAFTAKREKRKGDFTPLPARRQRLD